MNIIEIAIVEIKKNFLEKLAEMIYPEVIHIVPGQWSSIWYIMLKHDIQCVNGFEIRFTGYGGEGDIASEELPIGSFKLGEEIGGHTYYMVPI